jgi:hypothetical protein
VAAGIRAGVAPLHGDVRRAGRSVHRIRWSVSPRYRATVTLTARGFAFSRGRRVQIHRSKGRRHVTTTALLPGSGCYSVGVRGHRLRREIVFLAR